MCSLFYKYVAPNGAKNPVRDKISIGKEYKIKESPFRDGTENI